MSVPISATTAHDLLFDLVDIPSPSGEETEVSQRLVAFFEAHDREVWIDEVGNVRAPADDAVLLTSHIDTVPGDIPVRIEDGVLWGRGSVDAKGPLTALAITAVEAGVSFVGVTGEEVDSRGAKFLVEDRSEAPDALINGEPSGWDGITLGYRGLVGGTYRAKSDSGHSSRPEPNAIQTAIRWWNDVEECFDTDNTSVFESVTPKPTRAMGGLSDDGLAVESSLDVQFRIPPAETPESVQTTVEDLLDGGALDWEEAIPPVMASPRTPIASALRAGIRAVGGDPTLLRKTGTSDMNIYAANWECPMATYGPGDSDFDHAPDERLALDEFDRAIEVLRVVTDRLTEDPS